MTQLMKQRPLAVWCMFLAGAVVGGLSSSLLQPLPLLAQPGNLNGRKFEELERRLVLQEQLTVGISRDELGRVVVSDPLVAVELLVECDPESTGPALTVCGPALFTGDAGPDTPLVEVDPIMLHPGKPELLVSGPSLFKGDAGTDPLMTIMPIEHQSALRVEGSSFFKGTGGDDPVMAIMPLEYERALRVEGSSLFTGDPGPDVPLVAIDTLPLYPKPELYISGPTLFTGDPGPDLPLVAIDTLPLYPKPEFQMYGSGMSLAGPDGELCMHPDRIELLVDCGDPDSEVYGVFGVDELGSYLYVNDIFAEMVQAASFVESGMNAPF